jgi:hypothetical protein
MVDWLARVTLVAAIVVADCALILVTAKLVCHRWNEGGRNRLFGHFDTAPPRRYWLTQ